MTTRHTHMVRVVQDVLCKQAFLDRGYFAGCQFILNRVRLLCKQLGLELEWRLITDTAPKGVVLPSAYGVVEREYHRRAKQVNGGCSCSLTGELPEGPDMESLSLSQQYAFSASMALFILWLLERVDSCSCSGRRPAHGVIVVPFLLVPVSVDAVDRALHYVFVVRHGSPERQVNGGRSWDDFWKVWFSARPWKPLMEMEGAQASGVNEREVKIEPKVEENE